MKSILVINQPYGNRGDESAHRALIRSLNNSLPNTKIVVLTLFDYINAEKDFIVNHPNNQYINFLFPHNLGASLIAKWSLQFGFLRIAMALHPILKKLKPYYQNADWVLCAPGGICMGGFQDWYHLFMLHLAKLYKKPLAYYSRSFGPFPTYTWLNRRFKKLSLEILNYFSFLSIRDKKSMELADQLQLQYISSIDTAFLEKPQVKLPADIEFLANEKIIIFVPNSLTWHYAYQIYSQDIIDNFYVNILSQIQHSFPEHKIVMLPQLCSIGAKGDYYYFTKLQNKFCNQQNIIVLDDQYSSDVQQTIIRNATLVIGSRYHSIVFAINNNVPFVAINYEHKIAGLLELLHLSKYQVDITNIFSDKTKIASALSQHAQLLSALSDNGTIVTSNANQIALQCFKTLLKMLSTK